MGCSTSAPLSYDFTAPASVEFAAADPATQSGPVRRNPKFHSELMTTCYPDFKTLYDGFQRGLSVNPDGNCLGTRKPESVNDKGEQVYGEFQWKTYTQVAQDRDAIGSAMVHLGLLPPLSDPPLRLTALFSKNRAEWVMVEQACNAYGGVTVPLYDTLGADAVAFVLNQTEIPTVWADRASAQTLFKARRESPESMAHVKNIVQFEELTEEDNTAARELDIQLYSLSQIIAIGKEHPSPHDPPKADDVATFCYTSGTTGDPKGAMLTHGNIIADCSAAIASGLSVVKEDVHISYLPLAHMFERIMQVALLCSGSAIGFYQGNTLKLMEDIKVLQPTIFPSVPRLFNRIYDKVMAGVEAKGGVKAKLFKKGLAKKQSNLRRNIVSSKFWDGKVFGKVKAGMGMGRVRMLVTGSAPIAPHVMDFLKAVFACPVFEGYGQTECAAAATLTDANDVATSGHVGVPLPCNEIKLVSVEDMGYRWQDTHHGRVEKDGKVISEGIPCMGRGEICFRGPNVFVGYYKNDAKTAEALDSDGWLHSGDIGIWTKSGHLRVVDRKKNIFKLAQGEYVAPEKIENVYGRSEFVAQAFVHGDSLQSVLVAVIVPDAEKLAAWCPENGVAGSTMSEWVASPKLKEAILADLKTVGRGSKLKGFEIVKDIHLESEMWSAENGVLTPTFKLKRNVARERYQEQIDAMYAGLGGTTAGLKQGAVEEKATGVVADVRAGVAAAEKGDAKAAVAAGQAAAGAVGSAL